MRYTIYPIKDQPKVMQNNNKIKPSIIQDMKNLYNRNIWMINNSRTKILKANSPKINIIETKKKNGQMKIQENNNNRNGQNKRHSLLP